MLATAITTCVTFFVLFVVMAVVVRVEEAKGRRVVLGGMRSFMDEKIVSVHAWFDGVWHHFMQYIVKLGWYYSIHSLLRTILRVLVSVYTYIENIFERNREKAKLLRKQRRQKAKQTHLTQIADHKADTALTPEEQTALRKQKLEEEH